MICLVVFSGFVIIYRLKTVTEGMHATVFAKNYREHEAKNRLAKSLSFRWCKNDAFDQNINFNRIVLLNKKVNEADYSAAFSRRRST
jgi:hypothetical protein